MGRNMLAVRIRQAEVDLADGRLDEAAQIAGASDFRKHRKGKRLISKLIPRLVERGHQHLSQMQISQAKNDCRLAWNLGGNQPEIANLQSQIKKTIELQSKDRQAQQIALAQVNGLINEGQLSRVGAACDKLADTDIVEGIRQDVEKRRSIAEASIDRANRAVQNQKFEQAIPHLLKAKSVQPDSGKFAELSDAVRVGLVADIREHVTNGRLDQAVSLWRQLSLQLPKNSSDFDELQRVIKLCNEASSYLEARDLQQLSRILNGLSQIFPEASWISDAVANCEQAIVSLGQIDRGPLGLMNLARICETSAEIVRDNVPPIVIAEPKPAAVPIETIPEDFELIVDGAGSFRVLRMESIQIGNRIADRRPDLSVLSSERLPAFSIDRCQDDYFLRSEQTPININGKPMRSKLLSNNDRIQLGRTCTLNFTMPCSASTSACMEISGAKFSGGSPKKVILLDNALVIAPNAAAHIHSRLISHRYVVFVRNNRLLARPIHQTSDQSIEIEFDTPTDIGGVRIVAKKN